ncbi:MAG: hypothetical protein HYU52_01635 [Acidobacteria bacterium]|nr:hypothetical protein [Acidobacteriota bacterium]
MKSRLRASFLFLFLVALVIAIPAVAVEPTKAPAQQSPAVAQRVPAAQAIAEMRKVECVVQGNPVEFPDDLYIKNAGNAVIAKGWIVDWSIPNTSRKGKYTLAADLAVGAGVLASGQLPGGHPAGQIAPCTVAAPATLQVAPVRAKTPVHVLKPTFDCIVQGTPVEFPNDIVITNKSAITVAKGKTLHWEIPNSGRLGDWVLPEDLLGGKSIMAPEVVGGGYPAGAKCNVTLK